MSTVGITHTVTLHETSMQTHAQELRKVVVSGKYTLVFPQEAQMVCRADLVAALLRVAATKGGGTASRNAGIALARMAQNTQMLLRLKELRGLEIIHATARP
eukprot:1141013-Pelagomonas_calceolata.AAC.11